MQNNNIKRGNKLIAAGYSVLLVWFLCYLYFNAHGSGSDDLGLGVLVVGSFAIALLFSILLILAGLVINIHSLILDKNIRNGKNKIILCAGIIAFLSLTFYILFFLKL